ncbi:hypothetical protein F5I97DRAFT_436935 [Phlebopus sp. FC_14]|nr:hypothetical protein F5I97DRAFT_436935 [Phlebopus sp. FC_14]
MNAKFEGLQLAERHFGPLLSPITATKSQWTAYTNHRLQTYQTCGDMLYSSIHLYKQWYEDRGEIKEITIAALSKIERDMGLLAGTLLKCVFILWREVTMDDEQPRSAEVYSRIYSPSAPMYIDVHLKYTRHVYYADSDWEYALGYIIHRNPSPESNANHSTSSRTYDLSGPPQTWHTRNGWQTICWGSFEEWHSPRHTTEDGAVELSLNDVLDIHQVLFGHIEMPSNDDPVAVLAYRRQLVMAVRVLFASVAFDFKIACTDEERDNPPTEFPLEGFDDNWVSRGVRRACGFQLTRDPEEERYREAVIDDLRKQAEERDDDGYAIYDVDIGDENYYDGDYIGVFPPALAMDYDEENVNDEEDIIDEEDVMDTPEASGL